MDRYIKFAILTGVTKFGKISVFSDLNNLMDISMNYRYSEICGITEDELYRDFKEDIKELGRQDGYHFNDRCPDIYNPFRQDR